MPSGFAKFWRDIFKHWIWKKGPFDYFHAWAYLILWAVWDREGEERHYQGQVFRLERGQHVTTLRQLSRDWQRGTGWVGRYLVKLEKCDMLTRKTEQGCIVLTLCNYDRWQGGPDQAIHLPPETDTPAKQGRNTGDTPAIHDRRRVEGEEGEEQIWPLLSSRDKDAHQLTKYALTTCFMAGAVNTWQQDLRAALERRPVDQVKTWLRANRGKDVIALRDWLRSEDKRRPSTPQTKTPDRPPCPKCKGEGQKDVKVKVDGKTHSARERCVTCGGSGRLKEQVSK